MAFSKTEAFDFLSRAHAQNRLAHAYLITGPSGAGKRELAAQLAALVNHLPTGAEALRHPDVHVVEPESKSRVVKIEQMRELERELQMSSGGSGRKVGIVVDADRMNANASNSFLKTLEEPPGQSLLILLSANPAMLLETILSRCVNVQLAAPARAEPTGPESRLIEALSAFFKREKSGVTEVYGLAREFSVLLSGIKAEIAGEHEAAMRQEESLYKKTTDSGKWLDDREEYYRALTEARYIRQRFALVDVLLQWWADVLRRQQGAGHFDLPGCAADTERIAEKFSTPEILMRISHLEELRENFNRNVQENLAIEVAFLKTFLAAQV